jgi:hypothetical protein
MKSGQPGEALEAFLARIYVDATAREEFLADATGAARRAGLRDEEIESLEKVDRVGLELAARSFGRKRVMKLERRPRKWFRV